MNMIQITRELVNRGHRVDLIYGESGSFVPEYERLCASTSRVPSVDYLYPGGRREKVRQAIGLLPAIFDVVRRRPDVIYGNRVFSNGWAVPAGALAASPVVCHLHGHSELDAKQMNLLNRRVRRFVVSSEYVERRWHRSGLDPTKSEVLYNGIDPADYPPGGLPERTAARRALGLPRDAFVVTYVGRLVPEKGVDVLLRAWRQLDLDPRQSALVVVGSGDGDAAAAQYRRQLGALAYGNVRFLPGRDDVVTPLHSADVCVVPSTWDEPFGRTVIEGLATGRPVLASRVGGIPEILCGPFERFLFDAADVSMLSEKLRSLIGWRCHQPQLAPSCTEQVTARFTLQRMVDRLEEVFRAETTKGRGRGA
jgi:glycosyltransferase involved in cell wall biosynthesis